MSSPGPDRKQDYMEGALSISGTGPEQPGVEMANDAEAHELVEASLRKFQKELSSGIVSLALLALLAQAETPLYGYQIAKELESYGEGLPVKQGTLYPVLRSLEAGGLLSSEVEPSVTGPPRRYYRVTAEGQRALESWRGSWSKTRGFVDAVLEGHRG